MQLNEKRSMFDVQQCIINHWLAAWRHLPQFFYPLATPAKAWLVASLTSAFRPGFGPGLPEGCPILWQIYAWHCIVFTSHNNIVQKHNNKEWSKTIRNLTMVCINLSEYWTSMVYPGLARLLMQGYVQMYHHDQIRIIVHVFVWVQLFASWREIVIV